MKINVAPKTELDKHEILNGYSALARLPLTSGSVQELPFSAISWQSFEALVFQLVSHEYGPENCTPYGYPGQEQEGLDILISMPGEEYRVYQCKRVQKFTGTEFTKEFNLFSQGEWYNQTAKYYLVSSDPLQDTGFIKAFELKKRELVDKVELIKLGANELNSKLRIQPQLVYDFFGEEYAKHFCRQPELGEFQQRQKPQPVKPLYPTPASYIPRKLSKTGTQEHAEGSRQVSLFEAVCQQIEKQKVSFLIRSNAAYGKTTELNQLVSTLTENFNELLPLLIKLKHYLPDKHTLTEHLDLLYPNWSNYPQAKTLIMMDGIDEIPISSFADFTRKIGSFFNQYKQISVVMTLRSNFHNSGFVERISENRSFQEFTLDELGAQEISDFALSILKVKKEVTGFMKLCKQKSLDDLLAVPFYLVNLLELFKYKSIGFPKGRREAMDTIIGLRCREDAAKYDLAIQPAALLTMLKELTIVMTLKGLNSIYYSDIRSTVNFNLDQMKLSSLLHLEIDGLDQRISFIHANFQEYLFASSIVNLSSDQHNEILFSSYDRNHLKPKFLNVTNYLFSMMDQKESEFTELYSRLFDYNFESLALFEKDKISLEDRLTIFNKIIGKYKNHEFYFLRDNLVSSERLWEYINHAPIAFNTVLKHVNTGNDSSCAAFLDLVKKYPANHLLPASSLLLKNLLLEIIAAPYDYAIHDRAIDLLALFEIFDEETFIAIKVCPTIHFKMVRAAVFDYIIKWGKAKVELTYLLESAPFFTDKTDRVAAGLETKYIRTIVDVLDPNNYRQIMNYLIADGESCIRIFISAGYSPALLGNFYTKLGEIYQLGPQYTDSEQLLLDFYLLAGLGKREKLGSVIRFYQVGDRALEGITTLIDRKINGYYAFAWIEAVDVDFLVSLTSRYAKKEVDISVIYHVRIGLGRVGQKAKLDAFQTLLITLFPGEFEYAATEPDYDDIQRQKRENDYNILADKQLFLQKAEKIFTFIATKMGKVELGFMDFQPFQYSNEQDVKEACDSDLIFDKLLNRKFRGNLESLRTLVNKMDWEQMTFDTVHNWLRYQAKPPIPEKLKVVASAYYQKTYSPHLNFEKAIWHKPNQESFTVSNAALIYILFYRQGVVQPTLEQLQDLLLVDFTGSFDIHEDGSHLLYAGPLFEIVYQQMGDHDLFTKTVLAQLEQNRVHSNPVMQTFAAIIRHYQLPGMEAQLLRVLMESKWNARTKEGVLKTYKESEGEAGDLMPLMNTIQVVDTEWKWLLLKMLEADQDSAGAYVHLVERQLPDNILSMEGWQSELIIYGLRWASEQVKLWFFNQIQSNIKFDCGEKEINDWIEAVLIGFPNRSELVSRMLQLLETEVVRTADRTFCRRREIIHKLLRRSMPNNHDIYVRIMTSYQEMIKKHEASLPKAKEHYVYLYEFEREYYLESLDNPDEHLIPQLVAQVQ